MNVLLIRPRPVNLISRVNVIDLEPLELEYLYTVARQEACRCEIYDQLFDKRGICHVLNSFQPDIVAISGYITQVKVMLDCAVKVKEFNPHAVVVMGGVHAELNYKDFYTDNADYIIHSGGLEVFRKIVKAGGNLEMLENERGLCFRNTENEWVENQKEALDPNLLPVPDRSHFNRNKANYRYLGYSPCAIVKTSYSCPYKCSFCYCRNLNGGMYAVRDIEKVIEEIKGIDCENIHIVDDTFLVDRKRIEKFIALVKENHIEKNFVIYSRADFVVENEDLIEKLGTVGVRGIITGLEAISDDKLDAYEKRSSSRINAKCVEVLNKYNIDCLALFIIDTDATVKDFRSLFGWIRKMNLKYSSVSIFTPIPGTGEYDKYKDKLTSNNLELWDFLHLVLEPGNLSRKQFYLEYYKLFIKLFILGRKKGIYDFVNTKFVMGLARGHIREMLGL